MKLTLAPALDLTLVELARLFNRSFEAYPIDVNVDAVWLADRIRVDRVDLAASRVFRSAGKVAGIALIARRGWTSRLAAMGVIRRARSRGLGTRALEALLDEARGRGDQAMVLEVIEQNDNAVRLYRSGGFEVLNRLVGFHREAWTPDEEATTSSEKTTAPGIEEIDVHRVARLLMQGEPRDFPWQLSGETVAQLALPFRAFRLGDACAVLSDPMQSGMTLRALAVPPGSRRSGQATRLVRALAARFPGRAWKVPVLVPEEPGAALFGKLGFEREALSQLQMRIDLG